MSLLLEVLNEIDRRHQQARADYPLRYEDLSEEWEYRGVSKALSSLAAWVAEKAYGAEP